MSIRIAVDYDRCKSAGLCMRACPEVFEVRDDGYMYVLQDDPDESLRGRIDEAAMACPNEAITVE